MRDADFFKEQMQRIQDESEAEDAALWGMVQQAHAPGQAASSLETSEKYRAIVTLLHQHPILVGPTLAFIRERIVAINTATLRALYTEEQLEQMAQEATKTG